MISAIIYAAQPSTTHAVFDSPLDCLEALQMMHSISATVRNWFGSRYATGNNCLHRSLEFYKSGSLIHVRYPNLAKHMYLIYKGIIGDLRSSLNETHSSVG